MKKATIGGKLEGTFPERLAAVRKNMGWSQSELARRIWGETENKQGYTVARNRDRISAYESGRAKPNVENLDALARVFEMEAEDLAPGLVTEKAFSGDTPEIDIRIMDGGVFLRVNMITNLEIATEVAALLSKDPGSRKPQ